MFVPFFRQFHRDPQIRAAPGADPEPSELYAHVSPFFLSRCDSALLSWSSTSAKHKKEMDAAAASSTSSAEGRPVANTRERTCVCVCVGRCFFGHTGCSSSTIDVLCAEVLPGRSVLMMPVLFFFVSFFFLAIACATDKDRRIDWWCTGGYRPCPGWRLSVHGYVF